MRALVLPLLPAALVALPPRTLSACSCLEPPPPLEALAASAAVFRGTVLAVDTETGFSVRVSFEVTALWKGEPAAASEVLTPKDSAACGQYFEVGGDYLVYAYESGGELHTSLCSRTAPYSPVEADALGPPIWTGEDPLPFRRGNSSGEGDTDLSDAVFVLAYLFTGGPRPSCLKAADVDDSGELDISDAIGLLTYLFLAGVRPAEPFAACGADPTPDPLSCVEFSGC